MLKRNSFSKDRTDIDRMKRQKLALTSTGHISSSIISRDDNPPVVISPCPVSSNSFSWLDYPLLLQSIDDENLNMDTGDFHQNKVHPTVAPPPCDHSSGKCFTKSVPNPLPPNDGFSMAAFAEHEDEKVYKQNLNLSFSTLSTVVTEASFDDVFHRQLHVCREI